MITALSLLLIAAAPAGSTDGLFTWGNGNGSVRRTAEGYLIVEDEVWKGALTSSDSKGVIGTILYSPDSGILYAHGGDTDTSWAIAGNCPDVNDWSTCQLDIVALGDDSCQAMVTSASLEGQDLQFDGLERSFKVEWGGVNLGWITLTSVDLHNSSHDDGDVDSQGTMFGMYDSETNVLSLSWWNDRLCDGFVIQQQADCSTTGSGRLQCRGDADVWVNRTSTTTSLSFWGYEHMTTVKGFSVPIEVTLPHTDRE